MLLLNESNPYCDSLGGGEDRIRCAIRFVGVTGLSILPETSIELFLVTVTIGMRCSFRWVWRSPQTGEQVRSRASDFTVIRKAAVPHVVGAPRKRLAIIRCRRRRRPSGSVGCLNAHRRRAVPARIRSPPRRYPYGCDAACARRRPVPRAGHSAEWRQGRAHGSATKPYRPPCRRG
jgi:hypothetical protein